MKRTGIIIALTLAGCAARPSLPEATPVTHIPARGGWYCQPGTTAGAWDCVQDPELAANPPPPRPLPAPVAGPEPAPMPTISPMPLLPDPVAAASDSDAVDANAGDRAQPHHLDQLSPDRYTIQLAAMNTRRGGGGTLARLEPLLERDDLGSAFIARLERDGQLYYVLLIGVYDTELQARQAVEDLADDLRAMSPWVRSVRALQAAKDRARALEASGAV
jgi:septal ring-binding cell division protein DamX